MTHQPPFSHIRHATEVVIKSSKGELPRRPTEPRVLERGLDDDLWALLNKCWSPRSAERLVIAEVIASIEE